MKRLALIALLFISCEKEVEPKTPTDPPPTNECVCGTVTSSTWDFNNYKWLLQVTNNCSGNIQTFYEDTQTVEGGIYCTTQSW